MTRFSLTIFVVLAFALLPAYSDCSSVKVLRAYGEKHFKAIDGGSDDPEYSFRNSNFKLPNANSCYLNIFSPTLSSITCNWLVGKGIEKKAEAVSTYETLVQAMLKCVRRPETLERRQVKRKLGENASMLDTFPGMKATQRRAFEVSYGYEKYWWSVEMEYEVNDDAPP